MKPFQEYCSGLIATLTSKGWEVRAQQGIPFGRQYRLVIHGDCEAVLNCYHGKRGFKFVAAGKHGARLGADLGSAPPAPGGPSPARRDPFDLGPTRIGGDESGKGDFFGALVAALYHVDEDHEDELLRMGVMDCKRLGNHAVQRLAGLLEQTGRGRVQRLDPREYNPRYARTGNINILLGDLYGQCLDALLPSVEPPPQVVFIDRFTPNESRLRGQLPLPAGCRLVTRPRAEEDVAVAAASILARAEFLRSLADLTAEFGQDFPAGAGRPVLLAGRSFQRAFGREALADVAKTHFATLRQL